MKMLLQIGFFFQQKNAKHLQQSYLNAKPSKVTESNTFRHIERPSYNFPRVYMQLFLNMYVDLVSSDI